MIGTNYLSPQHTFQHFNCHSCCSLYSINIWYSCLSNLTESTLSNNSRDLNIFPFYFPFLELCCYSLNGHILRVHLMSSARYCVTWWRRLNNYRFLFAQNQTFGDIHVCFTGLNWVPLILKAKWKQITKTKCSGDCNETLDNKWSRSLITTIPLKTSSLSIEYSPYLPDYP